MPKRAATGGPQADVDIDPEESGVDDFAQGCEDDSALGLTAPGGVDSTRRYQ